MTKTVLVGFFNVPKVGVESVETEVKGRPAEQYARLAAAIAKRHPKTPGIKRVSSVVEARSDEDEYVETFPGMTLGQVFEGGDPSTATAFRTVGRFFTKSSVWDLVLVFNRAEGRVKVQAKPVTKADGLVKYSGSLSAQLQVGELPRTLKEILGKDVRDLKLRFRSKTK